MAAVTAIAAIVAIVTGLLVAKPFLIFIGIGLFLVGFLGVATLSETWVVPLVIVLVIIIMLTKKK
jgi:hypothetical protein